MTMEHLWSKYKTEGIAKNLSLQAFCSIHDVPYNQFEKFLKLRKDLSEVHKINITDLPDESEPGDTMGSQHPDDSVSRPDNASTPGSREVRVSFRRQPDCGDAKESISEGATPVGTPPVRIMVNIRMTNGTQISKRNMDYRELRSLVEKLEALC